MQANELRLGNWVYTSADWRDNKEHVEECQVTEISKDEIFTCATGINGGLNTNHKPILLTEEWLIKFGFDWDESEKDYKIDINEEAELCIDLKEKETFLGSSMEWFTLYDKINYVHQIQNLYFALTGDELTIKE